MTTNQNNNVGPVPMLKDEGDHEGNEDMGELFSTRRPKDFVAGLSSGVKNFGKGVVSGAVGLFTLPVVHAKEEGATGFVKGLGLGVVAGVSLPVMGAITGAVQIGRGAFNTPEAIMEANEGKEWNHETREWYIYSLKEEAERVLNESEEDYLQRMKENGRTKDDKPDGTSGTGEASNGRPAKKVKDMDLYNTLGVDSNATSGEIKKAYYLQAKRLHPDKNPDDPAAKEKFQKVGAAYQVLNNEELRAKYDQYGHDGVDDAPTLDPSTFYAMIFGSDKFEPLIGELKIAMMMAVGADSMDAAAASPSEEDEDAVHAAMMSQAEVVLEFKQKRREVQIALNLAEKLQVFVSEVMDNTSTDASVTKDSAPLFTAAIRKEAEELSNTTFGGSLLDVIGYVYNEQARKFLGFKHSIGAGIGIGEMRRKGHVLANNYRVARSALRTYQMSKKMEKEQAGLENGEKGSKKPSSEANEPEEDPNTPFFLEMIETLWNVSIIDVEGTLRKACRKILKDSSVSTEIRGLRGRGLLLMGEIFQSYGASSEKGLTELKQRMQDEMETAKNIQKQAEAMEQQAKLTEDLKTKTFTKEELSEMKAGDLKKLLEFRSINAEGCFEKADFVTKILEHQSPVQ